MDYENLTPQYRIEEYLEAIAEGWAEATQYPYPDYPSWRIEEFLDAFITYIWEDGDHPRHPCPEPAWRLEECLRAIYDVMTGAATPWPFPLPPTNRIEEYLAAIHAYLADGTELPVPEPVWRIEQWLAYVLDAVKQGGDITKTVSGTMVHITDALAKAALSVLASIEPIQDLHGYATPWPAGGGKNLLSPEMFIAGNRYINSGNGNPIDPVTGPVWKATDFIFIQPLAGETLTLNHRPYGNVPGIGFYDESETFISGVANNGASAGTSWTFSVPNGAYYIRLSTMQEYLPEIQLERGATASSWEPYENICPISGRTGLSVYVSPTQDVADATTYAIDWTSEAGTVYGGSLDVVTGVLTVTHKHLLLNDTDWTWKTGNFGGGKRYYTQETVQDARSTQSCLTSIYPMVDSITNKVGIAIDTAVSAKQIDVRTSSGIGFDTLSDFKAYIHDNPIDVVYELATPLTYQLSAQEVRMLLGEDYVWSSSGDTVSVTYYAEGNANPLQSLNILLGGNYSNPKTADDVSDKEALEIILGGNK